MQVTEEVESGRLAELLKQVQAGHEVVLTQDHKPVAKLVAAVPEKNTTISEWKLHSIKGHRVLTPDFSHADVADEIFGRR